MYTEGTYYEKVLEGGMLEGRQYVFPILFNIGTLMTSKQNMNDYGLYLNQDMSLHELIEVLTDNLYSMSEAGDYETITEQISVASYYIPHILYSAAGEPGLQYETGSVNVNRALFENLCVFTKALYQQQFQDEWEQYVQDPDAHIAWGNTIKVQRMMPGIEKKGHLVRK